MIKAQPWNINGVGFDAREAAREAARRQGKSLGEWLHGVIADHAEDHGLAPRALGGQERIDAVTARLEQMGTRPGADSARRATRARPDPRARQRRATEEQDYEDEADYEAASRSIRGGYGDDRRARRGGTDRKSFVREDGDDLLESAVISMERRAARSERRTGEALASMAKLLEETHTRREQEYDSVATLTQKLGELETNLSQRFAAVAENPIQGSLARLEARLDAIGRRNAAEISARQNAAAQQPSVEHEPIRRLEDKLNTILEAMQPQRVPAVAQASPAAMAAVSAAPQAERRNLGNAIAEISRRQRALDEPAKETDAQPGDQGFRGVSARDRRSNEPVLSEPPLSAPRRSDNAESMISSLRGEMAGLAAKVDGMRRDALLQEETGPSGEGHLASLRAELVTMAGTLGDLAPRRSIDALETSIAALSERIETSREFGFRDVDLRPVEAAVGDLRHSLRQLDPRQAIGGMEEELRRIADKVEKLSGQDGAGIERLQRQMEDLRDAVTATAERPFPVERIENQVAMLAERLERRLDRPVGTALHGEIGAATDALRAMIGAAPAHLQKIEDRLDTLAGRLDEALSADRTSANAATDTRHFERLVDELGRRFEAVQAPGADDAALDSLQRQVENLSERFERSETGLSALPTLAASMSDLYTQFEETRASVEVSAAQAARQALKNATDDNRELGGSTIDPEALRALQDQVEARSSSTLNAVHDMLGKVVNRLSTMEHEIADVRQRPSAAPTSSTTSLETSDLRTAEAAAPESSAAPRTARPKASNARPVIGDPREIRLGGMEPRFGATPAGPSRKVQAVPNEPSPTVSATEDGRRSDFIAAARRAAATAQAETAAAQKQMPLAKVDRAGLVVRSRDYVATHKRPMLMGIAALMMALGAIALVSRTGDLGGGIELAAVPAKSVQVAAAGPAMPTKAFTDATTGSGTLSPTSRPKSTASLTNPIPGSDPTPTGSIIGLPTFAAGAAAPPPRPTLSKALVAAATGGDVAAEYTLANSYTEGRLVPRDMKLAATWFEKAADAGSAPAQYRLASLYEKGVGVGVDKPKARGLYTKAANAGNPRAMHNLAVLLSDGDGHPDYAGAVDWFRKAAQYGVHDSQYNLAVLLGRGLGVPQNLVQSYQWFAVAAAANDTDAEKKREEVGLKLSAQDLAVAKALAASFQPKVPNSAAVEVTLPPAGWDGAPGASRLNSARSKISSL